MSFISRHPANLFSPAGPRSSFGLDNFKRIVSFWLSLCIHLMNYKSEHGRQTPWSENRRHEVLKVWGELKLSICIKIYTLEIYSFLDLLHWGSHETFGHRVSSPEIIFFNYFIDSPSAFPFGACSGIPNVSYLDLSSSSVHYSIASKDIHSMAAFHCWRDLSSLPYWNLLSVLEQCRGRRAKSLFHTIKV